MNIVFEVLKGYHKPIINRCIKKGSSVWILEPFYANHHKKGIPNFPPPLPEFMHDLIENKKIKLIKASQLNTREIELLSAEKAVGVVEAIFPIYKRDREELFQYVSDTLKSSSSENAFKIDLCFRLKEFFSVNIMLHRIEKLLGEDQILICPDTNIRSYLYIKELLSKGKQDFYEHPNIRFPILVHVAGFIEDLRESIIYLSKLTGQTLISALLFKKRNSSEKARKSFTYGVAIRGSRQLCNIRRGPDFIIDDKKIQAKEVVYFPCITLSKEQKNRLEKLPGSVVYPPRTSRLFSHFNKWKSLLWLSLRKGFLQNTREIRASCIIFFYYFQWLRILETVDIKHFITHCDFGLEFIGRNIALNQADVQTWYFTDSMNQRCNFQEEVKNISIRHPAWTYLDYDHLVTWNAFLSRYYGAHPGSFRQSHIVGCLWSGHIKDNDNVRRHTIIPDLKKTRSSFLLVAFDTTYSKNGLTSFDEGIAFARHLIQLADTFPDIFFVLKEKNDRSHHLLLDPTVGPELVDLYRTMDSHPKITTCSNKIDTSELIFISNMVVSFPFTSTTYEALSANKPAIWHDPMGYYKNTLYGNVEKVTSHSYEELKAKIQEIKSMKREDFQNPFPPNSSLMDPCRDGLAIDRFRDLLISN